MNYNKVLSFIILSTLIFATLIFRVSSPTRAYAGHADSTMASATIVLINLPLIVQEDSQSVSTPVPPPTTTVIGTPTSTLTPTRTPAPAQTTAVASPTLTHANTATRTPAATPTPIHTNTSTQTPTPTSTPSATSILPPANYGRHYPNGNAAVSYIYGSDGTWKEVRPAEYIWNYYSACATENHPFAKNSLIEAADGTRFFTAPDANCHLLLDFDHDGEIDTAEGGYAFHEHNGKGVNGQAQAIPFTNFWYDDNWLARYMSEAYARPLPSGLSKYADFTRWKIIGGDAAGWTPYGDDDYDRLALDGLYYIAVNNVNSAVQKWDRIKEKSGYIYASDNQRFAYPNIDENYHVGLFEILTAFLLDHPSVDSSKRHELLQHWVSLRSQILSSQERNGSALYGWRTSIDNLDTLINTETVAINVLALGAKSLHLFEAGKPPLQMNDNNFFVRSHNVLSAVKGLSTPGHMTFGPYQAYPPGSYLVDFLLRAPSSTGKMASIDVYNSRNGQFLASKDIMASDMATGNDWSRLTLSITVPDSDNSLEFRTYWHGAENMDVAAIRIRRQ